MILTKYLAILTIGFVTFNANAQLIEDSISMEANYTHQVFYSLDNGVISSINNEDWDIALACFQRGAAGSAIILNEANCQLWSYPGDTSSWNKFDTSGYKNWDYLLNSDTSWTNGAFNKYRGASGSLDMGWGVLNPRNNFWTFGDSLYLVQLNDDSFKKLWIVSLKTGIWEFKYANLDGSDEQLITIDKNNYPNRNFLYHSMKTHELTNREPNNGSWDIMFTKHVDEVLPDFYLPVSSVFNNRNIWSAKANEVDYDAAITATSATTDFNQKINNIGREWKRFTRATGWTVYDTIAYFIYDYDSTNFYRLVFTGFGGSQDGKAYFTKELLQHVDVFSPLENITLSCYPNPAKDHLTLLLDYPTSDEIQIRIFDLSGIQVYYDIQIVNEGITQNRISIAHLSKGMYILQIGNEDFMSSQKIMIN